MSFSERFDADVCGIPAEFTLLDDGTLQLEAVMPAVPDDVTGICVPVRAGSGGSVLPVTSVGDGAFADLSSLRKAELPSCVTRVGERAFCGCSSLSEAVMPGVTVLPDGLFCGCSSMERFSLSASVIRAEPGAFDGCVSLESIGADPGNPCYRSEDGVLFSRDMAELVRYPVGRRDTCYGVPEGVSSVGAGSFTGTLYLEDLRIPSGVLNVDPMALHSCLSIRSVEADPGNPCYRSEDGVLFSADMRELIRFPPQKRCREYDVPDGVRTIGAWAFGGCTGLRDVRVPEGVEEVGGFAFAGCSMLRKVTVPSTVRSVGDGAYMCCDSVREVSLEDARVRIPEGAFSHRFAGCGPDGPCGRGYVLDPVSLTYVADR